MNEESVESMLRASDMAHRRRASVMRQSGTSISINSAEFMEKFMDGGSERSHSMGGMDESGDDHRPGAPADHEKQREMVKQMAERETRKVNIWRRNVFLVVAATAALATAMTYFYLSQQDQDDFETSFREFAQTIQESTEFNLKGLIEGTNGLSQVLTSEAIKTGNSWPFMTLSSFEVYVRNTRTQGSSELVVVAPFVAPDQIEDWNDYSNANQGWIDESFQEYETGRLDLNPIPSSLYRFGRFKGRTVLKPEDGLHTPYPSAPFWQMSRPPFDTSIVNFNALSEESYQQSFDAMNISRHWVMGIAGPNTLIDYTISAEQHDQLHSGQLDEELMQAQQTSEGEQEYYAGFANDHPHTQLIYPVFQSKDPSHPSGSDIHSPVVAMIVNVLPWDNYLKKLLPDGVNGVYCILHNSAGQSFTYRIRGPRASYLGPGDLHDTQYDDMEYLIRFEDFLGAVEVPEGPAAEDYHANALQYWFAVYPSDEFREDQMTGTPILFAIVVACSFSFMTITFIFYDRYVTRKNNKVLDAATHSNAILASLFPTNVQQRLLAEKANEIKAAEKAKKNRRKGGDAHVEEFLDQSDFHETDQEILDTDPIADVFPEATVLFADLVGFTAWSSTREPTQVFILLETLYRNFDLIAKRRKVYKIETLCGGHGMSNASQNHPIIMVRFCMECLRKMKKLTRKLESKLGPDTSALDMRFGLHSGSVTGGVLRGERSRFQLFGDTMNTAARMESNGKPGRIHLSEATANLLRKHGKARWLEMREDKVQAKGKGLMQTYWITSISGGSTPSSAGDSIDFTTTAEMTESGSNDDSESGEGKIAIGMGEGELQFDEKTYRVVDWTTQSLITLLENLAASRQDSASQEVKDYIPALRREGTSMPLDEIQEVISFPEGSFAPVKTKNYLLGQSIEDQLEMFVGTIASKYPGNSFHNFFHASHVLQSFLKMASTMSKNTSEPIAHIISSDPLTVFSCAFACLIHDVEHPGMPNYLFKNEDTRMAGMYAGRCIAEQNSFDVAWKLLNEPRFENLRTVIVSSEEEAIRFRQIVLNAVIATDLLMGISTSREEASGTRHLLRIMPRSPCHKHSKGERRKQLSS